MSRRSGRFLLLALLLMSILAGVALYRYGYMRVRTELSDVREEQALKLKMLQKQVSLISRKARMEEERTTLLEERRAEAPGLVEGATAAAAESTMQQMVKAAITAKGGTVTAENVGRPEDAVGHILLNETVDAVFPDVKSLLDAVCALETQAPYLALREIDVRVKNSADPKDLTARLKISGLSLRK
jgi:hypothetical protein